METKSEADGLCGAVAFFAVFFAPLWVCWRWRLEVIGNTMRHLDEGAIVEWLLHIRRIIATKVECVVAIEFFWD